MKTQRVVNTTNKWSKAIGYSRAVKRGPLITVSGTTASTPEGALHAGDPEKQTQVVLERIGAALQELGASFEDVVETVIYMRRMSDWQAIGRAHAAVFGEILPTTTMVEISDLIHPDLLVEIKALAVVGN